MRQIDFPAKSPDLNPVEHYWDALARKVYSHIPAPATRLDLQNVIRAEAANIMQYHVNVLVESMFRRCRAVVRANGGHTQY